ncbi:hypothetical protein GCM10010510_51770 [Streptomyces anandii JCM 4720]|nr:hypothetical protein GCM10010510_51770 [Streptomyces anandii JCM 4720]
MRYRPCSATPAAPGARSRATGARGRDRVLPGTAAEAAADAALSAAGPVRARAAAEAVGRPGARASAVAQVTPIEDARNPYRRMLLILNIVIHICPSGN